MASRHELILASASSARRTLLTHAGLSFDVMPANIDEAQIRNSLIADGAPFEAHRIAAVLAAEKAKAVSVQHPSSYVIGADQVLAVGDRLHSKADTIADARRVLQDLRGRTHTLMSAAAIAKSGELLWQTDAQARLTMRKFSDAYLEDYLAHAGAAILDSVGCYELEGIGVQLFDEIEGDYFTILGLPLLPLLAELRRLKVLHA